MTLDSHIRVRFAPSPTGKLHLGNVYIAAINWLFAKSQGGRFLLRMDDTDTSRSTQSLAQQIRKDLNWLGLYWDDYAVQSERLDRYTAAKEALIAAGRLYPCYETPEELDLKRKVQQMQGKPPVYDREALTQTPEERLAFEAQGRVPHWRFKLNQELTVSWHDTVRGAQSIRSETQSDPVLVRADGRFLYTLSSCVDDLELGVTHILRGGDHVSNTVAQIQLFECLKDLGFGTQIPHFGHLPLIYDKDGGKLSKRLDSLSIERIRAQQEIEPQAIVAYMAGLGTAEARDPMQDIGALAGAFDIRAFNAGSPRIDEAEIATMSAKLVRKLTYETVADRIGVDETIWNLIAPNLSSVKEVESWIPVFHGQIEPEIEDSDYLIEAVKNFPDGPVTSKTWAIWTSALKQETGRKGRNLFMPLRKALTGRAHGPDMANVLELIGRDRALERLGA